MAIVMLHHFVGLNLIIIEELLRFLGSARLAIADLKVQARSEDGDFELNRIS